MTSPDWPELHRGIQLCNAVYEPDAAVAIAAFHNLGAEVIGRYCDDTHQAIACLINGEAWLVIAGTRFSAGPAVERVGDLLCDVVFDPWDIGGGAKVARGALEGMGKLWAWALTMFPNDRTINVCGHSLGGWRTCLTPIFIPAERIGQLIAWEPPKAGNAEFWRQYADVFERLTIVCHARDIWYHHPTAPLNAGLVHKPGKSILWLHDGSWSMVSDDDLPRGDSFADHGPDTVVAAVKALAG